MIYFNFEDEIVKYKISNCKQLLDYVYENKKDGLCYLIFDEIQEVKDWEKACKTYD